MTTFSDHAANLWRDFAGGNFFSEPAGAADSQCSTGQWNCSSCGWDGIGQCCSLCGAAWKSAAFFCMRNSANWQQEFRSVHGSQEVRSCGNVPDIMYCCFLGVEILGMSRGTVTWNGATGKRAGNHAFMQEEKNHGEGKDG